MVKYSILLLLLVGYQDLEVLLDRGYEQYSNEQYQEALETFNQAAKLKPDNAETYLLRGMTQFGLQQIRESVEDLEKAIEIDPYYSEAYQELGYVYLVSQAPAEAVKAFDKAIELNPSAELYVNRGTAKCMMNDREGAEADWKIATSLGVDYSEMMVCD